MPVNNIFQTISKSLGRNVLLRTYKVVMSTKRIRKSIVSILCNQDLAGRRLSYDSISISKSYYWKFKLISHRLLFQIFLRKKETKCIFKIICLFLFFFRANSILWKGKEDMIRTILKSGNLRQKTVSCRFSTSLRMSSRLLKQDEAIAIDQELFNE